MVRFDAEQRRGPYIIVATIGNSRLQAQSAPCAA